MAVTPCGFESRPGQVSSANAAQGAGKVIYLRREEKDFVLYKASQNPGPEGSPALDTKAHDYNEPHQVHSL